VNFQDPSPDDIPIGDADLVRRIRSGETELYRVLVERHQRRIFYLGRKFFAKPEDVEDYVQEVFFRAFRKLDTFTGRSSAGTGSFAGWLYTLAYRYAVNTKRDRMRERESFFPDIEVPAEDYPEEEIVRLDTIERVRKELNKLPGLYAMLIRLKYYEGFTFSQISSITGIPEGTLKSHVHRCKKILRKSVSRIVESDI